MMIAESTGLFACDAEIGDALVSDGVVRGETWPDVPRRAANCGPLRVVVDLVLVSPADRGVVPCDLVLVPAQWHRRAELLDHILRQATCISGISVMVYATRGDSLVENWRWRRLLHGARSARDVVQFEFD